MGLIKLDWPWINTLNQCWITFILWILFLFTMCKLPRLEAAADVKLSVRPNVLATATPPHLPLCPTFTCTRLQSRHACTLNPRCLWTLKNLLRQQKPDKGSTRHILPFSSFSCSCTMSLSKDKVCHLFQCFTPPSLFAFEWVHMLLSLAAINVLLMHELI